jgi:hypothetical protein
MNIWDKKNPVKNHKKLTPEQKAKAKRRAAAAGRPYPNLVDNIAVAKEEYLNERGTDSKGYRRSTESGAGLTKKGVMAYRRKNPGSKLQTAVTGKVKPGSKVAKRRKSFCARMSGMPGPMKDEKGRPTRKAASLRRWRCRINENVTTGVATSTDATTAGNMKKSLFKKVKQILKRKDAN